MKTNLSQFIRESLRSYCGDDVHPASGAVRDAHGRDFQGVVVQEEGEAGEETTQDSVKVTNLVNLVIVEVVFSATLCRGGDSSGPAVNNKFKTPQV